MILYENNEKFSPIPQHDQEFRQSNNLVSASYLLTVARINKFRAKEFETCLNAVCANFPNNKNIKISWKIESEDIEKEIKIQLDPLLCTLKVYYDKLNEIDNMKDLDEKFMKMIFNELKWNAISEIFKIHPEGLHMVKFDLLVTLIK